MFEAHCRADQERGRRLHRPRTGGPRQSPVDAQGRAGRRFGGVEIASKLASGRCLRSKHHAEGKRDLGIGRRVARQMLAKVVKPPRIGPGDRGEEKRGTH